MKRLLLGAVSILTACASPPRETAEPKRATASSIVGGEASSDADDAVVYVNLGVGGCTGTMVAPNLVLTARHCVSEVDATSSVCWTVKRDIPAAELSVQRGLFANGQQPDAAGRQVFVLPNTDDNVHCGNDVAFILLDRDLPGAPLRSIRFTAPDVGETVKAVGYGLDETNDLPGTRKERRGMQVEGFESEVGPIVTSEGVCQGDSGGPLFDAAGKIVGVASAVSGACVGANGLYTLLPPHEEFLRAAFEAAGHPLNALGEVAPVPLPELPPGGDELPGGELEGIADAPRELGGEDEPGADADDREDDDDRPRSSRAPRAPVQSAGCHAARGGGSADATALAFVVLVLVRRRRQRA